MIITKKTTLYKYLNFLDNLYDPSNKLIGEKDGCILFKKTLFLTLILPLFLLVVYCIFYSLCYIGLVLDYIYKNWIPDIFTNTLEYYYEPFSNHFKLWLIYNGITLVIIIFGLGFYLDSKLTLICIGYLLAAILCGICILALAAFLIHSIITRDKDSSIEEFIVEGYKNLKDKTCPIIKWEKNLCECGGLKNKCNQICN